jgi:hypothetical protein
MLSSSVVDIGGVMVSMLSSSVVDIGGVMLSMLSSSVVDIGGVMVSMLSSSVVDLGSGFEARSRQTDSRKDYKIGFVAFPLSTQS